MMTLLLDNFKKPNACTQSTWQGQKQGFLEFSRDETHDPLLDKLEKLSKCPHRSTWQNRVWYRMASKAQTKKKAQNRDC